MVLVVGVEAAAGAIGVAPPFGCCGVPGDIWKLPGAPLEMFGADGPVGEPWLAATVGGAAGPGGFESPTPGPTVVLLLSPMLATAVGGRPCGRRCRGWPWFEDDERVRRVRLELFRETDQYIA